MSDTTNIDDLPAVQNQNQRSVVQNVEMQPSNPEPQPEKPPSQQVMSELINGMQRASMNGMTMLPSRDIPRDTYRITQDQQVTANYVPRETKNVNYIDDHETNATLARVMQQNTRASNRAESLESFYEEVQSPLMLSIIYFAFQLPGVKRYMNRYFPSSLYNSDGNPSLSGLVVTSVLFGTVFYIFQKSMSKIMEL